MIQGGLTTDTCTLVTVLLFGFLAYTCRLPFVTPSRRCIRYTQALAENRTHPEFFDDVAMPATLPWERPGPLDEDAWGGPIRTRLRKLHEHGLREAVRARCRRAYDRAVEASAAFGSLWERYGAWLQVEGFAAHEIAKIVSVGVRLRDEGRSPWEVSPKISDEGAYLEWGDTVRRVECAHSRRRLDDRNGQLERDDTAR